MPRGRFIRENAPVTIVELCVIDYHILTIISHPLFSGNLLKTRGVRPLLLVRIPSQGFHCIPDGLAGVGDCAMVEPLLVKHASPAALGQEPVF